MKKAFSLSFFVIGLIALTSIMVTNAPSERGRGSGVNTAQGLFQKMKDEEPFKGYAETAPPTPANSDLKLKSDRELAQEFLDTTLSLEERLDAWMELHKKQPLPLQTLIGIAIAPNPFSQSEFEEHSVEERNFQREESFRIMALQSLERAALREKSSIELIDKVAKNASSPVVRQLAQKMKKFAKNGQSYSGLFEQAVMRMEVPQ